jgi:ribonuclease HI
MDDRIAADVVAAEKTLLDPAIRGDRAALDQWLDPEYTEIGQSGRLWSRDEIFEDLLSSDQRVYATADLSEPRVRELARDCYLLTYVIQVGERHSRRSSIWRIRDGHLRTVFNQGTSFPLEQ